MTSFNLKKNIVFLPCSIHGKKGGALYGIVKENKLIHEGTTGYCYFLLKTGTSSFPRTEESNDKAIGLLGNFQEKKKSILLNLYRPGVKTKALEVELNIDIFHVVCHTHESTKEEDPDSVIIIIYDDSVFKHSELLIEDHEKAVRSKDHFQLLASLLRDPVDKKKNKFWCFQGILAVLFYISNLFLHVVSVARPIYQYSALGSHLHGFLKSLTWALESLKSQRKISLKVGNYILATAVDICTGILLLHFLNYLNITAPLSDYLLRIAKEVVLNLHYLLQWLSGSPAGLKLNGPFNLMMGRFFMYHIKLWWIFLSVAQPVLDLLFSIFLLLGRLGVTFQAAILVDLLALVSFHIYCIYVYAARVYYLQLSGLRALWSLFLGRKHNPLRQRVDSCQYSPDQLFVGTLAFTVLLFLLPTTLMYYVVFTTVGIV